MLNSVKCLQKLLATTAKVELTAIELELAVYFVKDPQIMAELLVKYYKGTQPEAKRLEERVVKACIFTGKADYIKLLLGITKKCAVESAETIAAVEVKDWLKTELYETYNLDYLKGTKQYPQIPFAALYTEFNNNNILHYGIEKHDETLVALILQSDVNLQTKRKTDFATCLVLATKVCFPVFSHFQTK